MEKFEYQMLESLLGRMAIELGGRVSVTNGIALDGYAVAVFDKNGALIKSIVGSDIENIVKQFKTSPQDNTGTKR